MPQNKEKVHAFWSRDCEQDTTEPVEGKVTGKIPSWLSGRLIRNGPGKRHVGKDSYNYMFDGLALLHLINIDNGKATYMSKFLKSEAYTTNHRAQRIVFSEFGTVGVPDPCMSLYSRFFAWFMPRLTEKFTDNCLVNILQLKDELIAMSETSNVRMVDPKNLDTLGEKIDYTKYVSVQQATAHPHVEPDGMVYNLGFSTAGGVPRHCVLKLTDGKVETAKIEASVDCRWKMNPAYIHSFGITKNYFILVETPMAYDVKSIVLPKFTNVPAISCMKYHNDQPSRFRIISRKTNQEVATKYFSPEFFVFHFANCYETKGNIVVDLCATVGTIIHLFEFANVDKDDSDPTKRTLEKVKLVRFVIPVEDICNKPFGEDLVSNVPESTITNDPSQRATAIKQDNDEVWLRSIVLSEIDAEFPRFNYKYNEKPYTYVYLAGMSECQKGVLQLDCLTKVNVRTGETKVFEDHKYFVSEPVFVASPNAVDEDDGVALSLLVHKTDLRKVSLLVLDAKKWTELARVDFIASGTVAATAHGQFIGNNEDMHFY